MFIHIDNKLSELKKKSQLILATNLTKVLDEIVA